MEGSYLFNYKERLWHGDEWILVIIILSMVT